MAYYSKIDLDTFIKNLGYGMSKYPPVNVIKKRDGEYRIEFAVAGFDKDELSVTLADGVLTVSGKQDRAADSEAVYQIQGISSRPFIEKFTINNLSLEVKNVWLLNGILTIALDSVAKKDETKFEINIPQPTAAEAPTLLNEE